MTADDQCPTVLLVDDEEAHLEAYAAWLGGEYDVRTATRGAEALERFDPSVDAVLLDRRMPGVSGDEVLARIRDRKGDCRVAMITGVDPDVDIIDMGFDDYLVKPVTAGDLVAVVEDLLRRAALDADLRECYSLVSKKSALEAARDPTELAADDRYRALSERIEERETRTDEAISGLIETGAIAAAYDDIES